MPESRLKDLGGYEGLFWLEKSMLEKLERYWASKNNG